MKLPLFSEHIPQCLLERSSKEQSFNRSYVIRSSWTRYGNYTDWSGTTPSDCGSCHSSWKYSMCGCWLKNMDTNHYSQKLRLGWFINDRCFGKLSEMMPIDADWCPMFILTSNIALLYGLQRGICDGTCNSYRTWWINLARLQKCRYCKYILTELTVNIGRIWSNSYLSLSSIYYLLNTFILLPLWYSSYH